MWRMCDPGPSIEAFQVPIGSANQFNDEGTEIDEPALTTADPSQLKEDQRQVYQIITWHLQENLEGKNLSLLHMVLSGKGGTRKSKVIQTVTKYFKQVGAKHLLAKATYTRVTALLIYGKTTHTICRLPHQECTSKDKAKARLQVEWASRQYLILDEYFTLLKKMLAMISKQISLTK